MKPDRVIGLRPHSPSFHIDNLFPISGRRVMLPFLVVEAKKEESAVGFRAIQHQSAFPVRRLLRAQASLGDRDEPYEPCLVWFFAYQGEVWRLHIGIQDRDKVVSLTPLKFGQTTLMRETSENIRPLARNDTIPRWRATTASDCGLYMVMGKRRVPTNDWTTHSQWHDKLPGFLSGIHGSVPSFYFLILCNKSRPMCERPRLNAN
jgi:hypothetical protein